MGKIQEEKVKPKNKDHKLSLKQKGKSKMDVEKPMGIKKKVVKQSTQKQSINKQIKQINQAKPQAQVEVQKKQELYKEFSKSIEQQIEVPKTASKGQRERLLKKQKVMKKKLVDQYFITKQKQQPQTFVLDSLKNNLMGMEVQNKEQQRQIEQEQNRGTLSHQRNKQLKDDLNRMKQVFQIKPFQENPLGTIKMHLENTYAKK